ncbi:MAG: DUF222 domain-containing protein, partial [Solirubrobacteraceae bacterium]
MAEVVGGGVVEAVGLLRAAVDALLAADLTALSSTELTALLSAVEVQRRRGEAVDQRLLAEAVERGVAGEFGRTSPVDLLVELLRVSPREATARVGRARDLGPRRAVSGERLEPVLPVTAAAVAEGVLGAEHASVIVRAVAAIPA